MSQPAARSTRGTPRPRAALARSLVPGPLPLPRLRAALAAPLSPRLRAALAAPRSPRPRAALAAALLAVAVVLAASLPAAAQPYPPPAPLTEVTVTVTTPGATVKIKGRNWGPDTFVEISRTGSSFSMGRAQVGPDGTFEAEVTIPEDTPPGTLELEVRGSSADGRPMTTVVPVSVQARAVIEPVEDGLPRWAVLLAAAVGLAAILATWRLRRRTAAATDRPTEG